MVSYMRIGNYWGIRTREARIAWAVFFFMMMVSMGLLLAGLYEGKDCFQMMQRCKMEAGHTDTWCQLILTRWQTEAAIPGFTCTGFVTGLNVYGNLQKEAGRRALLQFTLPPPPPPPTPPRPPRPPPPPNHFVASNGEFYQMRVAECAGMIRVTSQMGKCVMLDYQRNLRLVIAGSCIGFSSLFILIYFFACSQKPPPTDDELKLIILMRSRQEQPWRTKGWQHTRPQAPKEA